MVVFEHDTRIPSQVLVQRPEQSLFRIQSACPQPIPNQTRARSASLYSLSSLPALSNSPTVSPHSPNLPQLSPTLTGKSLTSIFSGPQSPLKTPGFGFNKPGVVEEEDDDHHHDDFHGEFPASPPRSHTRHGSISSTWGRVPELDNRMERGSGLLRRLSLGNAFRPSPAVLNGSPPQVVAPVPNPPTAPREPPVVRKPSPLRGNSLGLGGLAPPAQDPIKKRGVSPMGERMLRGQFDGFN